MAVKLQLPVPLVMVTVVPAIEQAPLAPSVAANPDVAVAVTAKVPLNAADTGAPVKVMVWFALLAVVLCVACGAAL